MATAIHPALTDIWRSTRVLKATYGFTLGLMQITYHVFLYEHFGATPAALKITVGLYMLTSLGILCFSIPTGALGDYIGRKKIIIACFTIAAVVYFLRLWIYFIGNYWIALGIASAAAVLHAASFTLYSGTIAAWVVDSVHERAVSEGPGPILTRIHGAMMAAKIVGAMLGVWFYLQGMVFLAFGLGGITALLCAVYCSVTLPETQSLDFHRGNPFVRETWQGLRDIIRRGWRMSLRNTKVRYMVIMYASFMLVVHLVNALWPIAMRDNVGVERMTAHWYGIVLSGMVAAYLGTQLLASLLEHHQAGRVRRDEVEWLWYWFAGSCLLMGGAIFWLGLARLLDCMTYLHFLLVLVVFNVGYGLLMPAYETLLNRVIPAAHARERATINSFAPMLAEALMILMALPSSGQSGGTTVVGWMLPATMLLLMTVAVHMGMRREFGKTRQDGTAGDLAHAARPLR